MPNNSKRNSHEQRNTNSFRSCSLSTPQLGLGSEHMPNAAGVGLLIELICFGAFKLFLSAITFPLVAAQRILASTGVSFAIRRR